MFLPSVVHSNAHLSWISVMVQATDEFFKNKVDWQTYNHCLFFLYLASVAFGYGWILDTKFLKFLNKDWMWICKNVSYIDQELKY